jgi:hypothetical protein
LCQQTIASRFINQPDVVQVVRQRIRAHLEPFRERQQQIEGERGL